MFIENIVLGGGISGLTLTNELQSHGKEVLLLEKNEFPGGVLQSVYADKHYWDRAAHTIAVDEDLMSFFDAYGLRPLLQAPSQASKVRQLVIQDKIHNVESHPIKILSGKFLSRRSKWLLLKSLFKHSIKAENPSVKEFFNYHFGKEITENIVSAVFAGIYSGDIETLEMRSVMSRVYDLEQNHGSVIRGLLKSRKNSPPRKIFGIKGGMSAMNDALADRIKLLNYNQTILKINQAEGQFRVETNKSVYSCSKLYTTLPAYALAKIEGNVTEEIRPYLQRIEYAPMILVHVAFERTGLNQENKAFGFLCNQYEYPVFKGAIYNSILFPERATEHTDSYTIFLKPKMEWLKNDEKLVNVVSEGIDKFRALTKNEKEPLEIETSIWEYGIPQFNKPFSELRNKLKEKCENVKGFHLSGSYLAGVSIPDCIKYNIDLAKTTA